MRAVVLALLTLVAVAGGVFLYVRFSGDGAPVQTHNPREQRSTQPATQAQGERPWWDRYDEKGRRTSRLQADYYEPEADGRVRVVGPRVEFFMGDGQVLRIDGEEGRITMKETVVQNRTGISGGPNMNQVPRSVELHDVTIQMIPSAGAAPSLTVTLDNASFDNDEYRIRTEATVDEEGNPLPGDLVPVVVRGTDYDFDGRGLELQYNEIAQRLEYLRIKHGGSLVLKKPGTLLPTEQPPEGSKPATRPGTRPATRPVRPVVAAPTTVPATKPTTRKAETVYHASFQDQVVITRGGRKMASADLLELLFISPETTSVAEPAQPTVRRDPKKPATRPKTRPIRRPTTAPTRTPATAPATQPVDEQIVVNWVGPLNLVPLKGPTPEKLSEKEMIVRMTASEEHPLELVQEAPGARTSVRAVKLTHWTQDQSALLEGGKGSVEMTDHRGVKIVTRTLRFLPGQGYAIAEGNSTARLPVDAIASSDSRLIDPGEVVRQYLDAAWRDSCTLRFDGTDLAKLTLHRIELKGQVNVTHPRMRLDTDDLALKFAPSNVKRPASRAATQPADLELEEMVANGNVRCQINKEMQGNIGQQKFESDTLKLGTGVGPDGRRYARDIFADGKVHAIDARRDLRAGSVTMRLPAPKPPTPETTKKDEFSDIEHLLARDSVQIKSEEGHRALADELEMAEGVITLRGKPARVERAKDSLVGPVIVLNQKTQEFAVEGGGRLEAQQKLGGATRPSVVTWEQRLARNGDLIEATGNVTAEMLDPDGTKNVTGAKRVLIATTRPATRPVDPEAVPAPPATQPSDLQAFAGLELRSITLDGDAAASSTLRAPDGALLKLMQMRSQVIKYGMEKEKKRLEVPGAGTMLLADNRAPATRPAQGVDPMDIRGRTAVSWDKSLVYDEAGNRIELLGNVEIARQAGKDQDDPLRIFGDRVVAELKEKRPDAAPPAAPVATRPAAGGPDLPQKMEFKKVTVDGNVSVLAGKLNLQALSIEYDPDKHQLTARGTEDVPVKQLDANGLPQAMFKNLVYDTQKGQIVSAEKLTIIRRN